MPSIPPNVSPDPPDPRPSAPRAEAEHGVAPTGAELSIEPMVGWRSWIVARDPTGPLLRGLFGTPWPGPEHLALCRTRAGRVGPPIPHEAVPALACACGIYATAEPSPRWEAYAHLRANAVVTGFVALAGRVIEHTDGLRAERVRIIGPLLLAPPTPGPWGRLLRRLPGGGDRVATSPFRYWPSTGPLRRSTSVGAWLAEVRTLIERRYGVEVLVAAP